jgi:hypothetical protein
VCEEIVSPLYLPKHGRNERKVLNRTVCLLNLSNKLKIFKNLKIVFIVYFLPCVSTWVNKGLVHGLINVLVMCYLMC